MLFNCVIVEDDPAYNRLIASYIKDYPELIVKASFSEGQPAQQYIQSEDVDLLFADMKLPDMDGLDLVRSLPEPPQVIFITSFKDYAFESYELDAVDYLLKPINEDRFAEAVSKAIKKMEARYREEEEKAASEIKAGPEYFVIRADNKYVVIRYEDIIYVEAYVDMVKIHTIDKVYVPILNLRIIEQALPKDTFIRTHRSFIVNTKYINAFDNYEVTANNKKIPIGQSYKDALIEKVVGNRLVRK